MSVEFAEERTISFIFLIENVFIITKMEYTN